MVIQSIASDPALKLLHERLAGNRGLVHVSGLWGSSAPMLGALVASAHPRLQLYVTARLEEADDARDDMELFLGRSCELFPAWEALPGEGAARGEIQAERLSLCARLLQMRSTDGALPESLVIVTPVQALMQPVPTTEALKRNTVTIAVDEGSGAALRNSPEALLEWAIDRGFERLDMVESPGDVARRGDILDLFAPGETAPYRVQFFGEVRSRIVGKSNRTDVEGSDPRCGQR